MFGHHLNAEDFGKLVRVAPLVSIDVILRNADGRTMLGLRNNEPAKGFYFVPGGIIRKNERLGEAFVRILKAETGLEIPITSARLLGAFEHFYPTNRLNEAGYGTHYVVLAHELRLSDRPAIQLDDQHSDSVWWSPAEIMANRNVHENTKAYFRVLKD